MKPSLVIIGNGVAGSTLALKIAAQKGYEVRLISEESEFFFSRTALMYAYMGHLTLDQLEPVPRNIWEESGITRIKAKVTGIDPKKKWLNLSSENGEDGMNYDKLVIATGSNPRLENWPNAQAKGVRGLYHLSDLEAIEQLSSESHCKQAVIVGGGLIGVELAEMLHSRSIETCMLVREDHYWGSHLPAFDAQWVQRHIESRGVRVYTQQELKEIQVDSDTQKVRSIRTKKGLELPCQFVGIAIGVTPNIDFLASSGLETKKGVLVNARFETSEKDIYAIGDCAELRQPTAHRSALEPVWYTAKAMAEVLFENLMGSRTEYDPGPWFNSAKFFDIEYQTYGRVMSRDATNPFEYFHWSDPRLSRAITLAYDPKTQIFQGINAWGIRFNQRVVETWLEEPIPINEVVHLLESARFDPEFSRDYFKSIAHAFVSNH